MHLYSWLIPDCIIKFAISDFRRQSAIIRSAFMKTFYHILGNTLFATLTNMVVWFAITFYAYLETQSVTVTGVISGIYLIVTAASGFWLGSLVDHHRKKPMLLISTATSAILYSVSLLLYGLTDSAVYRNPASIELWVFVLLLMGGVLAGNIRNIIMPVTVSMFVPEDRHDKANGLVGMVNGVGFFITSAISGVLVAYSAMYGVLILAIVVNAMALLHLAYIEMDEPKIVHLEGDQAHGKIDLKGTFKVIVAIPGLLALILFTTFNNFVGGSFMALLDAYGLSFVSVQVWGFLLAGVSTGFMAGGALIAKWGLGKNPLRTMFRIMIAMWIISCLFAIQASLPLFIVGMFAYMAIVPFIEAAEQTILQKVVPLDRQGRVFGFAQSIEQGASPFSAFLIGPITQTVFIPFMTTGAGVELIGGWFGVGQARGIALVFVLSGIIGLIVTLLAMQTKPYRQLSARYAK